MAVLLLCLLCFACSLSLRCVVLWCGVLCARACVVRVRCVCVWLRSESAPLFSVLSLRLRRCPQSPNNIVNISAVLFMCAVHPPLPPNHPPFTAHRSPITTHSHLPSSHHTATQRSSHNNAAAPLLTRQAHARSSQVVRPARLQRRLLRPLHRPRAHPLRPRARRRPLPPDHLPPGKSARGTGLRSAAPAMAVVSLVILCLPARCFTVACCCVPAVLCARCCRACVTLN